MEIRLLSWPEAEKGWPLFESRVYRKLAQHSSGWQRMLAGFHLWEWRALALCEGYEILSALPFGERRTELGSVAMSLPTPASYAGVLHIEGTDREEAYRRLLSAFIEYGRREKIDILSLFSSPFREDRKLYERHFAPTYTLEKFYQYLPGDADLQTLGKSRFRNNLRRNLRNAEESGYSLQQSSNPPRELVAGWHRDVLSPRLRSVGAEPQPLSFFLRMAEAMAGSDGYRFVSVHQGEGLVAGGVFLFGWCEDIYLRAATSEGQRRGAAMLMDYEMIRQGVRLGVHAVNFQSSPSRQHPVYEYKRQWGVLEGNTHYMVRVLGNARRFLDAGKEAVTGAFPHYFVLPFSCFAEGS